MLFAHPAGAAAAGLAVGVLGEPGLGAVVESPSLECFQKWPGVAWCFSWRGGVQPRVGLNTLGGLSQPFWFQGSVIACPGHTAAGAGPSWAAPAASAALVQLTVALTKGISPAENLLQPQLGPECRVRFKSWGEHQVLCVCIWPETLTAAVLSPRDQVRSVLWGCCWALLFPAQSWPGAVQGLGSVWLCFMCPCISLLVHLWSLNKESIRSVWRDAGSQAMCLLKIYRINSFTGFLSLATLEIFFSHVKRLGVKLLHVGTFAVFRFPTLLSNRKNLLKPEMS